MTYRVTHPLSLATSSRRHYLPDMTWMTAMVSKEDAKTVYVRAFSRPPRLLFTNPVAFAFSLYYAYVYGKAVILALNRAFGADIPLQV